MINKILFQDNNSEQQGLVQINFSNLNLGMDIVFRPKNYNENIKGSVSEIFTKNNSQDIIGCLAISDTGEWLTLYEEDEVLLYIANNTKIQESMKVPNTDSEKVIPPIPQIYNKSNIPSEVQTNNENSHQNKNVLPNLFAGREFVNHENAKFPEWSIIPPNQFINPRIKLK